jgi:DNA mismatch repair protein MutL
MSHHRGDDTERSDSPDAGGQAERSNPEQSVSRLDAATRAKIAAGEIVSRPVDVVVELVENALDAGADRIAVEVRGDGTERLRVADDGRGMSRSDAALAVERHTTSKVGGPDDVERIATLGFRGEALPSIAAAGTLELTTNDGGAEGTRVVANTDPSDGRLSDATPSGEADAADAAAKRVEPAGRARGTTVEVRDLFASRPARRKSLSSAAAEFERISDAVAARALAHPEVAFSLSHDGTETFATAGSGAFADALLGVYDRTVAAESTTITHETTVTVERPTGESAERPLRIEGVVSYPSTTRARPDHVTVAVGGRVVRNTAIRQAVREGYGTLLPEGRYPIAVISVSAPPAFVDPNVDPAKREVAFRDAAAVREAVETAVADALTTADLRRSAEVATDLESSLEPLEGESAFEDVTVLGQFRDLYLLCEADDELLVIDQHAAHERINFERLREALAAESVPSASLSPPATVSLSPGELAAVETHAETLESLGFAVEPFGGGTARVRAVPAPLGRTADPESLRDVLDALRAGESAPDRRETLLKDLACHPSLKAGEALDRSEAAELLEQLGACEQPFACPHGRPTVLSIEESTLARGFERGATRLD